VVATHAHFNEYENEKSGLIKFLLKEDASQSEKGSAVTALLLGCPTSFGLV